MGCDVTGAAQVDTAIGEVEAQWGPVTVYAHNAAPFDMGAFADTDSSTFEALWRTMCLGAVHGAQRVLPGMLKTKRGVLLFVGATGAVKAGANFSAFGSGKFALRGLAQSLARELGPQGIHVAHLISQTGYAFASTGQYTGSLDDMLERYGRMLDEQASSYANQLSEWTGHPALFTF
jgi:NAD(P)-dependent dehydrogenase (short-subunit alcohol dehydrogenase family)